jgi:hypothetical protein
MVIEAGVVTGYVIAWVMRKARQADPCPISIGNVDADPECVTVSLAPRLYEVATTEVAVAPR